LVDAHQRSRASGTGIGRSSRATLGNLRSGRGPDRLLIGTSVRQFPKLFQQVVRVPGRGADSQVDATRGGCSISWQADL